MYDACVAMHDYMVELGAYDYIYLFVSYKNYQELLLMEERIV